jgi:predicted amino acid racemase
MLMLESGDRREGVPLVDLDDLVACVLAMPELELAGVATNFACFAGTCGGLRDSVETLAEAVRGLRSRGLTVARVSGGNSSLLALLRGGEALPGEITEIRCGEALLLGRDALEYAPLPDCRQDACLLRAQVLESYTKAAAEGPLRRLVLGLGSQDLGAGGLRFRQEGLFEAGRSADYLVVGVEAGGPSIEVGEVLEIIPSYYALSAAWTSPFVEVRFV